MNRDFRYRLDKAGNFIKFKNGKSIKPGGTGIYPVYGSNGIIGMSDEYREENSVIIGRVGAYCGSVQFCRGRYWASDNTIVASPKDNDTDVVFLYYVLKNANLNRWSGGAAQPLMTQTVIKEIELPHPDISIQRKIASILSAYDDLIENNTRRIQILEEMAQLIYREWFVNFRFPGHEKVKFVNSELGEIPEGWEVKRLSTFVETQYGYTESASDEIIGPKFLRGKDINKNSYIIWDEVPYCKIDPENYKKYRLSRGDIVIIRMADPGKVGIVEKDIDAVFGSYLIRLKIKNYIHPYYLFYFLLSDRYQSYISGASTGTTRKSASAGVITDVDILLPDRAILDQFVVIIGSLRQLLNTLLEKNENLKKTRDILLPKLISGEIDVSNLEIIVKEF